MEAIKYQNPDKDGYYGQFGGAFVPEMLYPNVEELQNQYLEIIESEEFQKEFRYLLKDYVGRATPLYLARSMMLLLGPPPSLGLISRKWR